MNRKSWKFFSIGMPDVLKEVEHVNDLTFIDCQGLAGAWSLGTAQAGFELVHRASLGKFGDEVIGGNRHLVPGNWEQDTGAGLHEWEPAQASYLNGTPPCSGFSLLNNSKKGNKRGPDSDINACMKELIAYAGRCKGSDGEAGPQVVSFESVQGAYSQGRELMQWLRDDLEKRTNQKYALTHVLCAGATIGAAQMRRRYYFVAHRIPFGVDQPEKRRVVTYRDSIGDLLGLKDQWDEQMVHFKAEDERNWWLNEQNIVSPTSKQLYGVDAHIGADNPRIRILLDQLEPFWPVGKSMETAMVNYYHAHRRRKQRSPKGAERWWLEEGKTLKGFAHPTRINPDRPGYVCTGGCVFDFVHWSEPRMLSARECARLMGYPDNWSWNMAQSVGQAGSWIGKCCPVTTGRWIATWVKHALQGNPGEPGLEIGEREYVHNSTNLYVKWLKEQQEEKEAV